MLPERVVGCDERKLARPVGGCKQVESAFAGLDLDDVDGKVIDRVRL
mgnify:CR=1 FL=1